MQVFAHRLAEEKARFTAENGPTLYPCPTPGSRPPRLPPKVRIEQATLSPQVTGVHLPTWSRTRESGPEPVSGRHRRSVTRRFEETRSFSACVWPRICSQHARSLARSPCRQLSRVPRKCKGHWPSREPASTRRLCFSFLLLPSSF